MLAVLFCFKLPDVSRLFLLFLFPTQFVLALATRAALRLGFRWLRERGYNARFVVVVGAGPRGQAFARRLAEHRELGLNVLGYVDDEDAFDLPAGAPLLGRLADLPTILHERVVDEVAVCLPFCQWDLVDAIAGISEEEGKIVRVPMDVLDHAFAAGKVEELDGTPVFSLVSGPDRLLGPRAQAPHRPRRLGGRPGPAQPGAPGGRDRDPGQGRAARLLPPDPRGPPRAPVPSGQVPDHGHRRRGPLRARWWTAPTRARSSSTTTRGSRRWARFLRRTSLDELPQLWNVLRGQMSLVGPRPAPPREVEGYDVWHRRRLSMKPGITGLWQVTARRNDDFDDRASLDLDYIDRWSLWLDVKILARTIPAALEGR